MSSSSRGDGADGSGREKRHDAGSHAETLPAQATTVPTAAGDASVAGVPLTAEAASGGRGGIELPPGTVVGEYRIEQKIGEGGMGRVFAAMHPVIGKRAAIKVLRRELCADAEVIERFVQEARAVNQIRHPNIVDIFGFGELADGRSYFVMERLDGESLRTRLRHGPPPLAETCRILGAIAVALEAAHEERIVHRDLKPDNVYLCAVRGERPRVKLLDFGIAKLLDDDAHRLERTRSGSLLGTPQYIAPEQARGYEVGPPADVYSLGVMAFEMLTGRPPFVADNAMDLIAKHLHDPPPSPATLAPGAPAPLVAMIVAMMAKEPGERPTLERVRAVLADVEEVAGGMLPFEAQVAATVPDARAPRPLARRRAWVALAAVLGGAVIAGGGVLWLGREEPTTAVPVTVTETVTETPAETETETVTAAVTVPVTETVAVPVRIELTGGPGTIRVDGAIVARDRAEAEVSLPPGRHEVAVTAPRRRPASLAIDVVAGKAMTVPVRLEKEPPAATPTRRPAAAPGAKGAAPARPADDDEGTISPFDRKPR